jgi:pilus assembly protein CpaE
VVLFDADLQFGDVANALRLIPETTFGDSVRAGLPDITALKAALTSHPTGLYALCAPDMPAEADDINGDHVARAIDLLHEEFAYVVIDTDAGLGERTLAAMEHATDLIFVCATDVPSVRALRKELEALDTIGMSHQRRHFVLNRADAKVGLSADDIQATVNQRLDIFIPSSRTVPVSMNQGSPLLESGAASPAAKALIQLVNRFVDLSSPNVAARRSGGLLRRKET